MEKERPWEDVEWHGKSLQKSSNEDRTKARQHAIGCHHLQTFRRGTVVFMRDEMESVSRPGLPSPQTSRWSAVNAGSTLSDSMEG